MTIEAQLADYLAGHNVITLATMSADGPWAAAVCYAVDGFDLIFLSAPHTRHCVHLEQDPRVAGTIQEDYGDWRQIQGLQLEGSVKRLRDADRDAALAIYQRKFPFVAGDGSPEAIQRAMSKACLYRLIPRVLYFIDNTRAMGHREQFVPHERRN